MASFLKSISLHFNIALLWAKTWFDGVLREKIEIEFDAAVWQNNEAVKNRQGSDAQKRFWCSYLLFCTLRSTLHKQYFEEKKLNTGGPVICEKFYSKNMLEHNKFANLHIKRPRIAIN